MKTYPKGSLVPVYFEFRDELNAPTDPTAIFFSYTREDDDPVVYTYGVDTEDLLKASVGRYYALIDASEVGLYRTRGYATGTGQSADEDSFFVPSEL